MKKFLFLLLLACAPAFATTYVFSDCGTGAVGGCVVGSDAAAGTSVATAFQTSAKFKTVFQAALAGDHLQFCQGGAWNAMTTGNMKNTNSTAGSPITIETVSCAAIYGGAGAGIKPKLNGTGNGGAAILSFNQASPSAPTAGWIIKDIEFIGDGSTTSNALFFAGNESYITIDNVKITLTATAIQIQGGVNSSSGTGTGIGSHYIIRNSTISQNYNAGILASAPDMLIENNTMTKNGSASNFLFHDIYLAELDNTFPVPQTITSLTGSGATVTMVTSAPHGLPLGTHFIITVTGASVNFNVAGVVGTVTGASTITYPATGAGSAGVVGTYSTQTGVPISQAVIRHNNLSEGDSGAAGACAMAHIVIHGTWSNVTVESNTISESAVPLDTCVALEIDSGGYSPPDDFEGFTNVVVRDNTCLQLAYCFVLDIAVHGLIENNYGWCSRPSDVGCILMRSKGGTTLAGTNKQNPDNITMRHNTVYLSNPDGSSIGIALNGNVGDALTGSNHNLYGNAVILGGTPTVNTQCFNTDNIATGKFAVRDYNQCYYLGASVPKWAGTSSLATVQGTGADTHSALTTTANITSGQPFILTPSTSPAIGASSSLINSGHPSLGPKTGWHGSVRVGPPYDGGAFEFGATLGVVPDSQVRLGTP